MGYVGIIYELAPAKSGLRPPKNCHHTASLVVYLRPAGFGPSKNPGLHFRFNRPAASKPSE